jgi:hypothetical protein
LTRFRSTRSLRPATTMGRDVEPIADWSIERDGPAAQTELRCPPTTLGPRPDPALHPVAPGLAPGWPRFVAPLFYCRLRYRAPAVGASGAPMGVAGSGA